MNAEPITCLNGIFLPADEARIPVADRGFRFGDGVFETIRLEAGKPYQWHLHLSRMVAGLTALRITPPEVDWQAIAQEMIARNHAQSGFLRISLSRGSGSRGYLPDAGITPTWVVEYLPPVALPEKAFTLWVSAIQRPSLAALPGNHKLAHGIGSTLALLDARDHGADEALMRASDGMLCETASANLFWIQGDTLFTPALSTGCLAGITRAAILRLSPIACSEVTAELATLQSAEAVFISNTRLGIWPVAQIAPNGWSYDAHHPVIRELTARLNADRASL
jgi:branched-chain amino acid aminotransferase